MADDKQYGVDVLVQPPLPNIDIVFVHGLTGHSRQTWESESKNWTRDGEFLPTALPKARIMTFGYNANVFADVVESKVVDHADSLLGGLLIKRASDQRRPLLFITHSLGGIVVKNALITATLTPAYRPILESTNGIIFLGTPHSGADLAVWLGYAQRVVAWSKLRNDSGALSKELQPFSDTLRTISTQFTHVATENHILIRSFRETKETRLGIGSKLIVEQGSAVMNHPNELAFPLAETHESICKYSTPQDSSYKQIAEHVVALAEVAIAQIEKEEEAQRALDNRFQALPVAPTNEPFEKIFEVYLPRNLQFQGRTSELEAIKEHLQPQSSDFNIERRAVVLCGMGGAGKSEIALHYAYTHRQYYDATFWISCHSANALKRDIDNATQKLNLESLPSWLRRDVGKRWLLVLDNLDNLMPEFTSWIPSEGGGNIIFTSRRTTLGSLGLMIKILPMNEEDAIQLLLRASAGRIAESNDHIVAKDLVDLLGRLPLAIQQCGSFIGASDRTLSNYPSQLGPLIKTLDLHGSEQALDDLQATKPILASWDISFDNLLVENPGAADLLCVLAFLEGSDIAEEILRRGFTPQVYWNGDGNKEQAELRELLRTNDRTKHLSNLDLFEAALQRLISYSLVFRKRGGTTLYMHPVTHYWAGYRLRGHDKRHWYHQSLRLISFGYPHPEFSPRYGQPVRLSRAYKQYKNHTRCLMDLYPTIQEFDSETATALVEFMLRTQAPADCAQIVEGLLETIPERTDLWFSAVHVHLSVLCDEYEARTPGDDLFRDLGNFKYAGTTWTKQLDRLRPSSKQETSCLEELEIGESSSTVEVPSFGSTSDHVVQPENKPSDVIQERGKGVSRLKELLRLGRSMKQDVNSNAKSHEVEDKQEQNPAKTTARAKGPTAAESDLPLNIRKVNNTPAMTQLVLPLPLERGQQTANHEHLISGIIGQIVIKFVQRWQATMGQRKTWTLDNGKTFALVESRTGVWVLQAWITNSRQASDLEMFCSGIMCTLAAKIDADEALNTKLLETATLLLMPIVGYGSLLWAATVYDFGWRLYNASRHGEIDTLVKKRPQVDGENFYSIVKTIDLWQCSLRARKMWDQMETLLNDTLQKFEHTSQADRVNWAFSNDPILDTLEFLVVFYRDNKHDERLTQAMLQKYEKYFDEVYHHPFQKMCLGFGIGKFGMSFARTRMEIEPRVK